MGVYFRLLWELGTVTTGLDSCGSLEGRCLGAAIGRGRPELVTTKMALETVELKNGKASATVYPLGATVTSFKAPHEVLFCRPDAKFDGSKPISGGIPHCFPQFGPGAIQQHGFARNLVWKVASKSDQDITLELVDNEETMAMWPNKFQALYKVTLADSKLNCELTVKNTDDKAWEFQVSTMSALKCTCLWICMCTCTCIRIHIICKHIYRDPFTCQRLELKNRILTS